MDGKDERRRMTRAAGVVGMATLASRVLGFLRDLVIAYLFGAGPAADAFFVAFRIPNLLRRLLAEGTLTIAFIPVFTETLTNKGRDEALRLARALSSLLIMVLLGVCAAGMVFAPEIVRVMAPGFVPGEGTYSLAVTLTRWCMPFIFFISLLALAGGVLNSLGHFFAPAFAPSLLNLTIIITALALSPRLEPPVLSLAIGVVLGGLVQFLLQVPFLRARGVTLRPIWEPGNRALRKVLRLMGPAAFGAAVYQLAVMMNTILASFLDSGSVSYLYYADRLIQFPMGIFAVALSTAILPSLSRQAAAGDRRGLVETMGYGLRLTFFIMLPAMAGLIILALPLVELLFQRGEFGPRESRATALALMGYGAGLWAFAAVRSVVQAFYAMKDTRTPVWVAAASLAVNLLASLALMGPLKHTGLAVATSLASIANLLGLMYLLRRRVGPLGLKRVALSLARILASSAVMGAAVFAVAYGVDWGGPGQALSRWVRPMAAMAAGVTLYLAGAVLLRMEELREIKDVFRRRRA